MAGKKAELNDMQKQFAEEYLVDLSETQAAIRAGYAPRSAGQLGHRLMKNVEIRAIIDRALAERSKRTGANADRVVRELARIAFSSPPDFINMNDAIIKDTASLDDKACVASIRVKMIPTQDGVGVEREIKLCDKVRALELLGKHLGMFDKPQTIALTGKDGGPIQTESAVQIYIPDNQRDNAGSSDNKAGGA